ncbi:uncharacterized protein LOC143024115 [Oratosquilla oratoria]|uniref:uncharacterized protein LOC143024115 n=1 Tax=Oratosquilla oratoria TaxID=337810 RepID=UPI003F76520B
MFNLGADATYVSHDIVRRIKPKWVTSKYTSYSTFGNKKSQNRKERNVYDVKVIDTQGNPHSILAVEVETICPPLSRQGIPSNVLQSLSHLQLADDYGRDRDLTLDILVGVDNYWHFVSTENLIRCEELVAFESVFGWILSDSCMKTQEENVSHQMLCMSTTKPVNESELHEFWSLESIGICAGRVSQRPSLSLLDNEIGARKRLTKLNSKFERNPSLRVEYDKVLKSYEDTVRPNGVSLNDCLESGPSLIPDLVEILLRFRRLTVQELQENLYVDDWLSGADTVEEANTMFREAQSILSYAGRTLSKWNSNNSSLSSVVGLEKHVFSDSSEKGYGSCVYLHIPKSDKEFHVRLVALSWIIGNPNRWKMFVANRVTEIQTLTSPSNWFHCPGTDNPADMMTRGLLADQLISNNMWLGGPNWLSSSSCFHAGANIEDETHILAHTCEESMGEGTALTVNERATSVFGFSRYSEFSKVMNIVAWVKRFIINCKPDGTKHSGPLTYEELIKAKDILICVQKYSFTPSCPPLETLIGLRQVAKRVCRECVACKRFDSRQCSQSAFPLPELRHYAVVYSDNAKTFISVAKALQQYFSVFSPE